MDHDDEDGDHIDHDDEDGDHVDHDDGEEGNDHGFDDGVSDDDNDVQKR